MKPVLKVSNADTIRTIRKKINFLSKGFSESQKENIFINLGILDNDFKFETIEFLLNPYFDIKFSQVSISEKIITSTLCWNCQKSCSGKECKFIDVLEPIDGWVADEDTINLKNGNRTDQLKSYIVYYCPDFVPDKGIRIPDGIKGVMLKRILSKGTRKYCPMCDSEIIFSTNRCPQCNVVFLPDERKHNYYNMYNYQD